MTDIYQIMQFETYLVKMDIKNRRDIIRNIASEMQSSLYPNAASSIEIASSFF